MDLLVNLRRDIRGTEPLASSLRFQIATVWRRVHLLICSLGARGPVVWDVIGFELSLREHVARQAGVKRVTVREARGRLIAGLDILARAWL